MRAQSVSSPVRARAWQAAHDPWLAPLPDDFQAWLSHRQSVITPPAQARVLASSELDGCQILRYSPQALSVQFHPEFTRSIMTACLPAGVADEGSELTGEDWARELLHRFWQQTRPQPRVQAQGA